jgi:hypothetical protein
VTVLSADGDQSRIDLSKVTVFDGSAWGSSGSWTYRVEAANGGTIDLSSVKTIKGSPTTQDDWLQFSAESGGQIKFGSAVRVTGRTRFDLGGSARLSLADLSANDVVAINLNDMGSSLDVAGNLYLSGSSSLKAAPLATVSIGDSFLYAGKTADQLGLDKSIVRMTGGGLHWLEAGGKDLGLTGSATGNFGFGQLVVGDLDKPATVQLVDILDNGNRVNGNGESLYLYGLGGQDGLVLNAGSTLVVGEVNTYAWMDGEWIHLNSLVSAAQPTVAFHGGVLMVPEPSTIALLAGAALAMLACRLFRRR